MRAVQFILDIFKHCYRGTINLGRAIVQNNQGHTLVNTVVLGTVLSVLMLAMHSINILNIRETSVNQNILSYRFWVDTFSYKIIEYLNENLFEFEEVEHIIYSDIELTREEIEQNIIETIRQTLVETVNSKEVYIKEAYSKVYRSELNYTYWQDKINVCLSALLYTNTNFNLIDHDGAFMYVDTMLTYPPVASKTALGLSPLDYTVEILAPQYDILTPPDFGDVINATGTMYPDFYTNDFWDTIDTNEIIYTITFNTAPEVVLLTTIY